jgi:hypothetical protein
MFVGEATLANTTKVAAAVQSWFTLKSKDL